DFHRCPRVFPPKSLFRATSSLPRAQSELKPTTCLGTIGVLRCAKSRRYQLLARCCCAYASDAIRSLILREPIFLPGCFAQSWVESLRLHSGRCLSHFVSNRICGRCQPSTSPSPCWLPASFISPSFEPDGGTDDFGRATRWRPCASRCWPDPKRCNHGGGNRRCALRDPHLLRLSAH